MITLMVNVYGEDPQPAISSALKWIPAIDHCVVLHGRYEGFAAIPGAHGDTYASEHDKRNRMLEIARPHAARDRFLLWLDADERVTYASPQLPEQLRRCRGDVVGFRFIHPLPPDQHLDLMPGFGAPGRTIRDRVDERWPGRLFRHLATLEFRHRHDYLVDTATGRTLMGWAEENVTQIAETVDLEFVHLWWAQPEERRAAKQAFYTGQIRDAESKLRVGRNV